MVLNAVFNMSLLNITAPPSNMEMGNHLNQLLGYDTYKTAACFALFHSESQFYAFCCFLITPLQPSDPAADPGLLMVP